MGRKTTSIKAAKAKREAGGFIPLSFVVIRSQAFAALGAHAVKLLCDLLAQYRCDNNGDLCASWTLMRARGWKSRDTLYKALRELLEAGWIIVARQGGRHAATLYAVTFFNIDYCKAKLDVASTATPTGEWKRNGATPVLKPKAVTRSPCQSTNDQHAPRVDGDLVRVN